MYCQNRMVHTVQEGDSLYRLARQYHTTVTELILGNPGVNPYNLQVGMKLYVCPGESYVPPQGGSANTGNTGNKLFHSGCCFLITAAVNHFIHRILEYFVGSI